jgi:hypothetical protein
MDEQSYTSTIKLANWETLSIRRRIERFNSRQQGQGENFELRLLPLDKLVDFILEVTGVEEETTFVMSPSLFVDESVADFKCKIWLENIAGEKCPEIQCK